MRRMIGIVMWITLAMLLTGCAKKTMVVLVSDPDGKVGHITVENEAGSVDVTEPGEATYISGKSAPPTPPEKISDDAIAREFSDALAILPEQPEHFLLYFKMGSTELTDDSAALLPQVLAAVERRKSQDISVVGHADTSGDRRYNLQLSRQRADAVTQLLIQKGVSKAHIESTSHGEENPLIKTADNVSEAKNRRVEVVVR